MKSRYENDMHTKNQQLTEMHIEAERSSLLDVERSRYWLFIKK